MAVFLLTCKEMAAKMKKFQIWMVLLYLVLGFTTFANGTVLMEIQW